MKTSYIFIAILVISAIGTLTANRAVKTGALATTGALSLYGLSRILG